MLNLSDLSAKIRAVTVIIFDLQTVGLFHTEFIGMLMTYQGTALEKIAPWTNETQRPLQQHNL